jgi:hypothetical protein
MPTVPSRFPSSASRRAAVRSLGGLAVLALASAVPRPARAQGGLMLQGIADVELWKTGGHSLLLDRRGGRLGDVERLQLWSAIEPVRGLVIYAQGQVETGPARHEAGTEWYADQVGVKWSRSAALVLDVGKMPHPVGEFAARRFSNRNPLIGAPDGYPVEYPYGAQLSGARGRVDYRAAVVSLPVFHEGYVPDPSAAPRPALGGGITLAPGVRLGASATWGSYLNCDVPASLLAGRSWRAARQRVGGLDAQVSRGYLELHGELGASSSDVPGLRRPARSLAWYTEAKYTLGPRLFVAGRVERNDYPFIVPADPSHWSASATDVYNGELGAGVRLTASTLVKLSARADRWMVPAELRAALPNGAAVAFQLSQSFDVLELARPRR